MLSRVRRLLLLLLLCTLPVQSMGAVIVALSCGSDETHGNASRQEHASHVDTAAVHHHDVSHTADAEHDHSGSDHSHLCCHHFSSGTPYTVVLAAPRDFAAYSSVVGARTPLHIPELPQRPPRA